MNPRRLLLKVHLVVGCAAAPMLAVLGFTGAVLAFEEPLDHLLNRRLLHVADDGTVLSPAELETRLVGSLPGYRLEGLWVSPEGDQSWRVELGSATQPPKRLLVDPHTGAVLGAVSELRTALSRLHQMHTRLLAGAAGRALVGWGGVALVVLSLSGLALWWPRKILRVRRDGTRRRLVFELHAAVGGAVWGLLLLLGLTGIGIHWNGPVMSLVAAVTGERLPSPFPEHAPGCEQQPELPLSRLVGRAQSAVPGARLTTAYLGAGDEPTRVVFRFPEDHTPAGRTNVFLASCRGEVLEARSTRAAPVAYRALAMWNRELHTGDLWGWPTRILAALASLSLPVLALTGPWLWWSRRRKTRL